MTRPRSRETSQDVIDPSTASRVIRRPPQSGHIKFCRTIPTVIYEEPSALVSRTIRTFKAWLNSSDADPWRVWKEGCG
jgi:hypothetical protein